MIYLKPNTHNLDVQFKSRYGYYISPRVFEGNNKMRIFQEEFFGPVFSVNIAYRMERGIQAGRVWTNRYHQYG